MALALAAGAGLLWWLRPGSTGPSPADQNVLLITIDTLRADALGSYGGRASTPNLDRLAARGRRFTFAHAHSVMTLPSHTTILTGRLPFDHGIRDNSGYRVKEGTATLATRLKAAGYATGAFVAAFPLTKRFGLTLGFDEYDDQIPEMRGAGVLDVPERRADAVVSRAQAWIDKQPGRFFGWVHVFDPHSPYTPPDEYLARHPDRPYDAEVSWTDAALGPLLDRLAVLPRPTLVIVTSDHGESLGEHGELTHGMFAYEPTLRVPLIVATIGGSQAASAGAAIDAPARLIDVAPTILEAAGVSADETLPGTSLLRLDGDAVSDRPAYFEALTYNIVRGWAPLRGVLSGRTKYIDLPIPELYDLAADAGEQNNLAPGASTRILSLAKLLAEYNTAAPERPGRESAETAAALRSLGYVAGSAPVKSRYTEADDPKRLVALDRDLQRANDLYQSGKIDETMALLRGVISQRKDTADAYVSLAHILWESGKAKDAIATLEQALTAGAPGHDLRMRLGLYLAESGTDPKRAVTLLERLPKDDVEVLNALGIAHLAAGRPDDATAAFRGVLALDATNGLAYQNLAAVRLQQALAMPPAARSGLLGEAAALARQAIDADPALAKAYTTLGVVQSESGQKAEAIDSWKRAVALDPAEFDALYNLTVTLRQAGRVEEARTYARQFVATAPPGAYGSAIQQLREFLNR
jgi:arylsulfatase A-like enzyme